MLVPEASPLFKDAFVKNALLTLLVQATRLFSLAQMAQILLSEVSRSNPLVAYQELFLVNAKDPSSVTSRWDGIGPRLSLELQHRIIDCLAAAEDYDSLERQWRRLSACTLVNSSWHAHYTRALWRELNLCFWRSYRRDDIIGYATCGLLASLMANPQVMTYIYSTHRVGYVANGPYLALDFCLSCLREPPGVLCALQLPACCTQT